MNGNKADWKTWFAVALFTISTIMFQKYYRGNALLYAVLADLTQFSVLLMVFYVVTICAAKTLPSHSPICIRGIRTVMGIRNVVILFITVTAFYLGGYLVRVEIREAVDTELSHFALSREDILYYESFSSTFQLGMPFLMRLKAVEACLKRQSRLSNTPNAVTRLLSRISADCALNETNWKDFLTARRALKRARLEPLADEQRAFIAYAEFLSCSCSDGKVKHRLENWGLAVGLLMHDGGREVLYVNEKGDWKTLLELEM